MTDLSGIHPLSVADTVSAGQLNHRLALGVQFIDALSQLPASPPLVCDLEAIGTHPCPLRFAAHGQARQALRHAGRIARLLEHAAGHGGSTVFRLRAYGQRKPGASGYVGDNDPRLYVPRRLALTPVLGALGVPPATRDNIRDAWLWPGAAYPLPANATALRGQIRRGPSLALAREVPWARLVVTRPRPVIPPAPPPPPDFDLEARLAWGHGDDRGEFLVLLGGAVAPGGAAMPAALTLRLWVFLPPAGTTLDAADPLASLPLEEGGGDALNDVLRGRAIPPGYVRQTAIDLSVRPGGILSIPETALLYG